MARLPQALDMQAPNGVATAPAALDFSSLDRALQGAARQVERYDQARKQADDAVAGRIVEEAASRYNAEATERWAAYDGRTAGQDLAEAVHFDTSFAALLAREDLSDGEREAVRRQVTELRRQTMVRATATAAQVRAQRYAADRDANENAAAQRIVQDGMADWAEREAEARRNLEAGGDLAGALTPAWDAFVAERLAPHPQNVRDRATAIFDRQRGQLVMGAIHEQEVASERETRANTEAAANQLINRVRRDPGLLLNAPTELSEIAASLPRAAQAPFIASMMQKATAAHMEARIIGGDADAVEAEMAAGAYDSLPASVLETARASIKQAQSVMTVEKAFQIASVEARHLQNLAAIARGDDADDGVIADARDLVKPEDLVQMLAAQQAAERLRPFVQELRKMDPAQAEIELQRLEAQATTVGEKSALTAIRSEKDKDFALRASDAAAWAMTPAGRADMSRTAVQAAWADFSRDPSAARAQAYAARALAVQTEGGVAEVNRRLIPRATARDLVAGLDRPGVDATQNVRRLAQYAEAFGPHKARVLAELSQAGMTPRATGALMHYSDQPQALERYAAGLAATPTAAEKQAVERVLREELADYERTMASGVGMEATKAAVRTAAAGAMARGESATDAVRAAVQPITGDWAFGRTFAVPRSAGLGVMTVEAAGRQRLRRFMDNDLRDLRVPNAPGYTAEQSRRRWRDVIKQGDYVTKPDETGIVYMIDLGRGPEPLVQKNGRPVELSWGEVAAEARRDPELTRYRLSPLVGQAF